MGVLEDLMGGLSGASEAMHPQLPQVLQGLLGTEGGGAGLPEVLDKLEQGGLGSLVQSWLGNGPNQPVAPDQLNAALGAERVQGMAAQAGLPAANFLGVLAQHLPGLVDRLSPNGRLPPPGEAAPAAGG